MTRKVRIALIAVSLLLASNLCNAAGGGIPELSFEIKEYRVEGNTLIAPDEIKAILAPYVGQGKTLDTVRQAHNALQKAYHDRGFVTVRVTLPEQELENGIVRFLVLESVVGRVQCRQIIWILPERIGCIPQRSEG